MATRKISENPINTIGNMTPMIFFDMIFDLDFGVISYIANNLLDPQVFDESKFHLSTKQVIHDIYYRKEKNPLVSFLLPEHQSEADEYYLDIMSEYHDEVVERSMVTEIYNIIRSFVIQPDITVSVLVKDEFEEKIWREMIAEENNSKLDKIEVYYRNKLTQETMQNIQQVFCKYPSDILGLNLLLFQKTFYFASYEFNFEEEGERSDELDAVCIRNTINKIDLYKRSIIGGKQDDSK